MKVVAQTTRVVGPFTIVDAVVMIGDMPTYAVGISKCSEADDFDARAGYENAIGRAVASAYYKPFSVSHPYMG